MLPIALGDATKTVPFVMDGTKTYRFTVGWGAQTTTDDLEGTIVQSSRERPTVVEVEAALGEFRGEIDQVPPSFSAIKVAGERAYDLARDGETVVLAPRRVNILRLDIIASTPDATEFETECTKGTYVRSLARDLGIRLGCFGHVAQLRRTGVGPFRESDLVGLDRLTALEGNLDALDALLCRPATALAGLPEIVLTAPQAGRLFSGNSLLLRGAEAMAEAPEAFATLAGQLVAIGAVEKGMFHPRRVFH
jgi:tRNA pseudouridine55 synthase